MNKLAYTHLENIPDDFVPYYSINLSFSYIKCPSCGEILNSLEYESPGYEYGRYNPNWGVNFEPGGTEITDDTTFACGECGDEISSWEDCEEISIKEKRVLKARYEERLKGSWNIKNFKKNKKVDKPIEEEKEEIIRKERITKIINLKVCKYCKRIIPKLELDGEKTFCPYCMKEYHEKETTRPIF